MAFFDKIGETISSKSRGVAQKAKDMAEISDLNKQINQCNQKINDSYMEIGYYYYQAHKDDGDDPFAAQCANIRQAMEQAEALRGQIQRIKGVRVCPNCHAEVPHDSQYCGYCGFRLAPPQGQPAYQGQPGSQSQPVSQGQPGIQDYYGQAAPEPQAAPQPQPMPGAQPESYPYGQPVVAEQIPQEQAAPQNYGYGQPEQPTAQSQPDPQPAGALTCPGCGSPIGSDDIFCAECGRKLK